MLHSAIEKTFIQPAWQLLRGRYAVQFDVGHMRFNVALSDRQSKDMSSTQDPPRLAIRDLRLTMRLMGLWWIRRGERRFPTLEDFNPAELSDVWRDCFTLMLKNPLPQSTFVHVGKAIAEASGDSEELVTLELVEENTLLGRAASDVESVLERGLPLIESGEFMDFRGQTVMFRSILLPVSRNQEKIDYLIGGARFKAKRSGAERLDDPFCDDVSRKALL